MANIGNLFPSKFLKAADLGGQERHVVIAGLSEESVSKDEVKPALSFSGVKKQLVLNRTNAETIAANFGPETDAWVGQKIILFSTKVQGPNGLTDGIRVRIPSEAAAVGGGDDDVFSG